MAAGPEGLLLSPTLQADPPTALMTRLAAVASASEVPPLSDLQALFEELTEAKSRLDERRSSANAARSRTFGASGSVAGGSERAARETSVASSSAVGTTGFARLSESRAGTPVASSTRGKASISSLDEDIKPDLAPFHDVKGLPAQLDRVLREESIAGASAHPSSRHSSPDLLPLASGSGTHTPRSSVKVDGKNKRKRDDGGGTPTPSELDVGHITDPESPDVPLHQPAKVRRLDSVAGSPTPGPDGSRAHSAAPPNDAIPGPGPASAPLAAHGSSQNLAIPPQASHLVRSSSAASATPQPQPLAIPPLMASKKRRLGTPLSRMSSVASFPGSGTATGKQGSSAVGALDGERIPGAEDDLIFVPVQTKLRYGLAPAQVQELALPPVLLTGSTPAPQPAIPRPARSTAGPGLTDDFTYPSRALLPPPPISRAPVPHPKVQSEVTGDFSKTKQPASQVSIHQFQSYINDNYLRSFGEDDLAFLGPRPEEVALFAVPALGRHYSEVWREEDAGESMTPGPMVGGDVNGAAGAGDKAAQQALEYPPMKRVRRDEVTDSAVQGQQIEVGPVTERLVSALRPVSSGAQTGAAGSAEEREKQREIKAWLKRKKDKGKDKAANGAEGDALADEPGWVEGGAGQAPMQLDSVELETRIKRELKHLGLLTEDEIDWSQRVDDPISSALRAAQRAYRSQHAVNEARRARLAELVRERMAWQEYEGLKEGLDRAVEQGWVKRQRQEVRKKAANRKKAAAAAADADGDEKGGEKERLAMPEGLLAALEKRQRFIEAVGAVFEAHPEGGKAYYRAIPRRSVYEDIEAALEGAGVVEAGSGPAVAAPAPATAATTTANGVPVDR